MEKRGLTDKEAEKRLKHYGLNEIQDVNKVSIPKILFRQIKGDFIVYLLIISAALSFLVHKYVTAYAIIGVIVIVVGVGFFQEYKAESAIQSLKKLTNPRSIVIRNDREKEIPSNQIVPDDIIVLRAGSKIPADCIILEEKDIRVNESVLTGESSEVRKKAVSVDKPSEENMLYAGTFVVSGRCIAKVLHTGMNTKFGKIAKLISTEEKELPLKKKLNKITRYTAFVGIGFAIATALIMLSRADKITNEFLVEVLIVAIAFAVSSFPEGLPVTLITTLSMGSYRMAKQNAIVNRMSIIETLGETTVICTDKTGTITKGEMTSREIIADGRRILVTGTGYEKKGEFLEKGNKININDDPTLSMLMKASVYCNDSQIEAGKEEYSVIGTPTEVALMIMASKAGIFGEDMPFERHEEIPFTSERKIMSVMVKNKKQSYVFTKGAPEIVIKKCSKIKRYNGEFTFTEIEKHRYMDINSELNRKALRTLAIAYKEVSPHQKKIEENDLVFLGIVAMEDPPREEVRDAIETCRKAGIEVKMITGDHKETALSIAKEIGLSGKIMLGDEMDNITDEELKAKISEITIFARVRPEHKLRIVNALKAKGEVVTMTGDGVNDAPALKAAHIGVAMGKNGTDVSREVADLTLKDDNFSTIVKAIAEGRTIFNNMRKFVTYQLSCNFAEIFIIFIGVLIGMPLPLLAIQILFMNIVTDDIPSITLALNPASEDIMTRKPRRGSNILNKQLYLILLIAGAIMGLGTLWVFYYSLTHWEQNLEIARTTALITLIFFEVANAFNFRSFRKPVLTRSPFVNKYLVWASAISIIATFLIVDTPLSKFFETYHVGWFYWLLGLAVSMSVILAFDLLKFANKKYNFWNELY